MTKGTSKQICAVVDIQGFYFEKVFYPREFACVSNEVKFCTEVSCEIPEEIRSKHFKHFSHQQQTIHGLPVDDLNLCKIIKAEELKPLINHLYSVLKTERKFIFGVKNYQASSILTELGIPHTDLNHVDGELVPTFPKFYKYLGNQDYCYLHSMVNYGYLSSKFIRCSLQKCIFLWNFLQSKHEYDGVLEMLPLVA